MINTLKLDLKIVFLLLILILSSLVILYSASFPSHILVQKQLFRIMLGFTGMIIAAQIPLNVYYRFSPIIFFTALIFLIVVLGMGHISKGAQRWINIGIINFQPSELMRVATPLMLAWYLSDKPLAPALNATLISLCIILTPTILIAKQPDLGTALLILISGCATIFATGIALRLLGYFALATSILLPGLWFILHDYQKHRILMLFDPSQDPFGKGYHIIQSKIAIGSGGILGKGWLQGTQSHLSFLPEHTTDFIFAQFTEEFGLIGACLLILIYTVIIFYCLEISKKCDNIFGKILSCNLTMLFFCYVFVNIGMVCGILPVVGVPLPFISYGGTSIVTLMISFGILMGISQKNFFYNKQ